jgi:hypothetical protein
VQGAQLSTLRAQQCRIFEAVAALLKLSIKLPVKPLDTFKPREVGNHGDDLSEDCIGCCMVRSHRSTVDVAVAKRNIGHKTIFTKHKAVNSISLAAEHT